MRGSAVYVVLAGSEIVVKRIELNMDGSIDVISDNPSYKARTYRANQVDELRGARQGRLDWGRSLMKKTHFRSVLSAGAALCLLLMSGCGPKMLTTSVSLGPDEVAWSKAAGKNTISGFAVLRTVGGEARTCTGAQAYLTPDSAYARDRVQQLYGSLDHGFLGVGQRQFESTSPYYEDTMRKARCDGQGHFTFEQVPDGIWYVATAIVWSTGGAYVPPQGGYMFRRIEVRGGQTLNVELPA